jgi:hypothetical protein
MKNRILAAFAALLLIAGQTFAAESLAVTSSNPGRNFTKYSLTWVSAAGGTVSQAFGVRAGSLIQVKFVPGTAGNQPTDLYDVTILDADGYNVLSQTSGADLSNATPTLAVAADPRFIESGILTLTIAAAGNTKSGTIVLYFQ